MNKNTAPPGSALYVIGLVALTVSLVLTIWNIGFQNPSKQEFFELTRLLLTWKVIVGGITVAAGITFREQIGKRIAPHQKEP